MVIGNWEQEMEIPAKMESRLIDSKAKPAVSEATACKVCHA
jgi:hypothetical protein